MSPPTTLITFRVRAPHTRTLRLYGSWDNFTIPYSMSKDLQSGSQYWSGCFNFSNIICDGRPGDTIRSRSGGLKMGGTYWYFYKLSDDTDFHNVCERATATCPMMPGQLVNVLNIPYAFSGNRSRNPSTSSTSSERRTMNPEDKFMNPRPAPAKPDVLRVGTSPVLDGFASLNDDHKAPSPLKETSSTTRFLRLPKKASVDAYAPSPAGALADGLRAAFKIRTRSQSPESRSNKDSSHHRRPASAERGRLIHDVPEMYSAGRPQRGLMLRADSEQSVPTLSFERHRQQRSRPREGPVSRSVTPVGSPYPVETFTLLKSSQQRLDPLKEVGPTSNTPIDEVVPENTKAELDLEKRLPTLPNTPSSAYPVSMSDDSPRQRLLKYMEDMENTESHFSATTIDTEALPLSVVLNERSHFSAWTTTTDTSSTFVDASVPLPYHGARSEPSEPLSILRISSTNAFLPPTFSHSSICSSTSTTPSTSFVDTEAEFHTMRYRDGSAFNVATTSSIQHYSLPEYEYESQTTLKAISQECLSEQPEHSAFLAAPKQHMVKPDDSEIVHSESMQRLLAELSYLSAMIQT